MVSPEVPTGTIAVGLNGRIDPAEIPQLCRRVRALAHAGSTGLIVDVGALVAPDMVTVDALARMQLTARRLGLEIRVVHARHRLAELLVLTGLAEVFSPARG